MSFIENFTKSFIKATIDTFKIQIGMDITPQTPLAIESAKELTADISGVIGITSDSINGHLSVMFTSDVFLKIVSKMLMEEYSEINEENDSAAGELSNIILGQAKKNLNENYGQAISYALPSIIKGHQFVIKAIDETQKNSFAIPFETEFGIFHIKLSVSK
jgi:chemotaxis protein CheX